MASFKDKYGRTWFYNLTEEQATLLSLLSGDRFVSKKRGEMFGFCNTTKAEAALTALECGEKSAKQIAWDIIESH